MIPIPSWSCVPAGKSFPRNEPSGEGGYTAPQGLHLLSWAADTLFMMLNWCWGQYLQVHIAGNSKMRTNFVFHAYMLYMLMLRAPRNSRGSNKRWNEFIYTHKHVIHLPEHPPIIGAKMRKCFSMLSPDTAVTDLEEACGQKYTKKAVYYIIIYIYNINYYLDTRDEWLWCSGDRNDMEKLIFWKVTKMGNILGVVEKFPQ